MHSDRVQHLNRAGAASIPPPATVLPPPPPPSNGARNPDPTPKNHQPAYDAVFAYIRALGDRMPADPVHRNAMIWRAVAAALDAGKEPADA